MTLDPRIRALFAGPNYAHVATLLPDGSPHSAPVWIDVEGDDLVFTREESSVAMKNLRRDPRVAISIHNVEDPYECAYVRGRVKELREGEAATRWLHQTAVAYTGVEYPSPVPAPCAVVVVAVEHAGYDHFTKVQHTPPSGGLQLPRS
jgi:PPOX class probable F420-dependent enzyme